ncbi:MAG TPA: SCO family protein [Candidatus Limnocylindria bacterium]|jgi:protein SCO1/2|nr:SCO family protein [Candidatus Limnocylindria bacterium]
MIRFRLQSPVRAFIAAVLLPVVAGCHTPKQSEIAGTKEESVKPLTDRSLYQTQAKWITDSGKEVTLASLRGRPQVVVMFFSHCQMACPILVHNLQTIESSLQPELRARVGFTLVSIDPRRDTPAALAEFRQSRHLTSGTWTLLHGETDDILELAALLGVKYKEEATGQFSHSNLITVLNSGGEIDHQWEGLAQDTKAIVREIETLLSSTHASVKSIHTL